MIEVAYAAVFAKDLTANTTVYLGFIEVPTGHLKLNYRAAHGAESQEVGIEDACKKRLLDDMDTTFPSVFMKPIYPVWKNPFFFLPYH